MLSLGAAAVYSLHAARSQVPLTPPCTPRVPLLQRQGCNLYFPVPLAAVYGSAKTWAFSGAWLSITGKRMDSQQVGGYWPKSGQRGAVCRRGGWTCSI